MYSSYIGGISKWIYLYGKCDDYTTMSHFAVANPDPWTMWDITVLYIYKYYTL
jgi:hypothetical protein